MIAEYGGKLALSPNMIDALALAPSRLRDAPVGSIFVPLADRPGDDEFPFLVGTLGDKQRVLVALRGQRPFHIGSPENWSQRGGYCLDGIRIEVDRATAARRFEESDSPFGEVVRYPGGVGIIGEDGGQKLLVDLFGEPIQDSPGLILFGFTKWEVVTGHGADRLVLYHFTGRDLLFGPFDPKIDDEE